MLILMLCLFASFVGMALFAAVEVKGTPQVIIFLGPPGSGKGTQAARLAKETALPHISTGDLFRENMNQNTELGQKAKGYINAGKLVPDELVLDMLFERVSRPDSVKGYILDGFPRTIPQAEALDKYLKGVQLKVFNLDVPDSVIMQRITGRLSCTQCGNIQHKEFSSPKEAGKCDKCGGQLTQRKDDSPEVVTERLKVYHAQTEPLIEYYQKQGKLTTIDGQQSPDEVYTDILQLAGK